MEHPMGTELLFLAAVPVLVKLPFSSSSSPLRSQSASATLKSCLSDSPALPAERRHPGITVKIGIVQKPHSKTLEIQLTDTSDPYFYCHLEINEEDFHNLKTEQNLLVDFASFPLKFVELLKECSKPNSSFVAHLRHSASSSVPSILSIIETNSFRNITHLSLNFIVGNDAEVKQYLAGLVKEFKTDNANLKAQLSDTSTSLREKLNESQGTISKLQGDLEHIRLKNAEDTSKLELSHANKISQNKERYSDERESIRSQTEEQVNSLTQKYERQITELNTKLTTLSTTNTHVVSHTQTLETQLGSTSTKISSLEKEVNTLRAERDHLNSDKRNIEKKMADSEKDGKHFKTRSKELEEKLRDREDRVRGLESEFEKSANDRVKLDETVGLYKAQTTRLEDSLSKATGEINKGNEIIRKLQSDLKTVKSKIKLKNVVTLQQEKLLDERMAVLEEVKAEMEMVKKENEGFRGDTNSLKNEKKALETKLEEGKKIIEDNNHVIEWLHKQLNEDALRSVPLTATAVPQATSIAEKRYTPSPFKSSVNSATASQIMYKRRSGSPVRLSTSVGGEDRVGGMAGKRFGKSNYF